MDWMDELEKAVRRTPERMGRDDEDGEDEEGMDREAMEPAMEKSGKECGGMKKAMGGKYEPADNGDDEDEDGDVGVHDPDALDSANNDTGKKQKLYPKNQGGIKKGLESESIDAIDASEVLTDLTKSLDRLTGGATREIIALKQEVASLAKGLGVIGKALAKSLEETRELAKSLASEVETLGRQPAVRKSNVRTMDKSFVGNENTGQSFPSKAERLAKSLQAIKDGKIDPIEASAFETACNRGHFPQDLWRKMGGE